jgi:uncharacterized repeat protein (TIGR03806 family)
LVRSENKTCLAGAAPATQVKVGFENAFPSLQIPDLIQIFRRPGDTESWFAVTAVGKIFRFEDRPDVAELLPVLDISDVVVSGGELGLLGLAFHPDYLSNGRAFVYYSTEVGGFRTVIAEYRVDQETGTFDPASAVEILSIPQKSLNHKGGHLVFGPDGYLYIGVGDDGFLFGGGALETSQDLSKLNGKMLRIDVDSGSPYAIPPDNPFIGQGRPEIFAYGLRNPWRWSFDRATGRLWVADVGRKAWEEVNIVEKGGNYGWPFKEGFACHYEGCESEQDLIDPVYAYSHDVGAAIIGGATYRGQAIPELRGRYLFADFAAFSQVWSLEDPVGGETTIGVLLEEDLPGPGGIRTFTEDSDGEIYVNHFSGIYKLVPGDTSAPETGGVIADTLSQTGCFDVNGPELTPVAALVPYMLNSPLWSDGLAKRRWFALPDGAEVKIGAGGDWEFPVGSVLVKEFSSDTRKIETRLLMRHTGGKWGGYTYKWNEEQTEAHLLPADERIEIDGHPYDIPSRQQCLACHLEGSGFTLGPENQQLKREVSYPSGVTGDQLTFLIRAGYVADFREQDAIAVRPLPGLQDDASEEHRIASYLHANCSSCHQPGGTGRGDFDLRFGDGLLDVCGVAPVAGTLGLDDPRIIVPGSTDRSILYQRIDTNGLERMPPLARNRIDPAFVDILAAYITDLTSCN